MSNDTLGYHRDMSAAIFGVDSEATKYLDEKIAEAPRGREEKVIAHEDQFVHLLLSLHLRGIESATEVTPRRA
jgi:hypothetical protein